MESQRGTRRTRGALNLRELQDVRAARNVRCQNVGHHSSFASKVAGCKINRSEEIVTYVTCLRTYSHARRRWTGSLSVASIVVKEWYYTFKVAKCWNAPLKLGTLYETTQETYSSWSAQGFVLILGWTPSVNHQHANAYKKECTCSPVWTRKVINFVFYVCSYYLTVFEIIEKGSRTLVSDLGFELRD